MQQIQKLHCTSLHFATRIIVEGCLSVFLFSASDTSIVHKNKMECIFHANSQLSKNENVIMRDVLISCDLLGLCVRFT